jgi:hypothetical protein
MHTIHTVHKITTKSPYCAFLSQDPIGLKEMTTSCFSGLRLEGATHSEGRKTGGNISDGLKCCIWLRAENPAKMTHFLTEGGTNRNGCTALLHPDNLSAHQPEFLAQHRLSAFLGKKMCHLIHDFHPD